MNWRDRIASTPEICHGQACIRGTRVMVSVILDSLADGETPKDIVASYHITPDDVQAALHYAADLSKEQIFPLSSEVA